MEIKFANSVFFLHLYQNYLLSLFFDPDLNVESVNITFLLEHILRCGFWEKIESDK